MMHKRAAYKIVYLLLFYSVILVAPQNNFNELLPQLKEENIRYKIGSTIVLRCDFHLKTNFTWQFRVCQTSFKGEVQCDSADYESPWKQVEWTKKKLKIYNSTEQNTGVYRCLWNDSVIKQFVVAVVAPPYTGPPPEVFSLLATNTTIIPNSKLVIKCKVKSSEPTEIRWFRSCSGNKCNIELNDNCYCSLLSATSKFFKENYYYSKLLIPNTRTLDSGQYLCFAISSHGSDYKAVSVKILDTTDNYRSHETFSLLFLIPLGFMLVPTTVWLCYYRNKSKMKFIDKREWTKDIERTNYVI